MLRFGRARFGDSEAFSEVMRLRDALNVVLDASHNVYQLKAIEELKRIISKHRVCTAKLVKWSRKLESQAETFLSISNSFSESKANGARTLIVVCLLDTSVRLQFFTSIPYPITVVDIIVEEAQSAGGTCYFVKPCEWHGQQVLFYLMTGRRFTKV